MVQIALVAGCTVAFPLWWRIARRTGIFLICAIPPCPGMFPTRAEWTRSALAGVLSDPVSFGLFAILWLAVTAFLEER